MFAVLQRGAFAYPAYRRYWLALVTRVLGLQFSFLGSLWLVAVELDRSPIWAGAVSLCSAVPTIVLSIPAGVLADRADNRKILVFSFGVTAVCHLALALLVVSGGIQLWMVVVWALTVGSLAALANPAQQALLPRLIEREAMPSAVAFTSSVWNGGRIIGPALAGLIVAFIGTGQAFFVTASGFALSTVLLMSLQPKPIVHDPAKAVGGMLEGVRFVFHHQVFLATIGLSFFTSIFGMSYQVLLPFFAKNILDTGSIGFGLLEMAAGIGALIGTLWAARLGGSERRGPMMLGGAALFGLFVALFSASRFMPLSMALLFAGGLASSVYLNLGMTTLQLLVPDELRGRVMGIWSMTWFLSSVGGFVAGALAALLGTAAAVALGAIAVSVFACVVLALSSELRTLRALPREPNPTPAPG